MIIGILACYYSNKKKNRSDLEPVCHPTNIGNPAFANSGHLACYPHTNHAYQYEKEPRRNSYYMENQRYSSPHQNQYSSYPSPPPYTAILPRNQNTLSQINLVPSNQNIMPHKNNFTSNENAAPTAGVP